MSIQKTTTFEKIFIQNPIKKLLNLLNQIIMNYIRYKIFRIYEKPFYKYFNKRTKWWKIKSCYWKYINKNSNENKENQKLLIDYYIYVKWQTEWQKK